MQNLMELVGLELVSLVNKKDWLSWFGHFELEDSADYVEWWLRELVNRKMFMCSGNLLGWICTHPSEGQYDNF